MMPYYTSATNDDGSFHIASFCRELKSGDIDAFMKRLKVFFAKIPYPLNNKNEKHYQAIFYIIITLMGQYTDAEVQSAEGTAEEAIKQIDDKGYLIPYQLDGRKLIKWINNIKIYTFFELITNKFLSLRLLIRNS